mmetsp:Transcript_47805/g.86142  ORF Transcript_47805/g.86142 Transcript_47805/m.86142 type:complete len:334 (-) Transcript_47805:240-1241(-)
MADSQATGDFIGVLFIILSEFLLAGVNAIVKFVPWSPQEIMVVRYSVDFVLCLSTCAVMGFKMPSPGIALRLTLRGAAYCAFIAFLWAGLRSCLPMGDVVVLVIASSPIFLVASARALLHEEIPARWPLQLVLCIAGALLIDKPLAIDQDCPASTGLLPLGAGFFGAMMNLASRSVKEVPPPVVCLFNDMVAVLFGLAYMVMISQDQPALEEGHIAGLVVLSAIIGWVGLMSNVKGYQSVSFAGIASIAGYISVPLGYGIQVFIFGEVPDLLSGLGALLICSINLAFAVEKLIAAKRGASQALQPADEEPECAYKQLKESAGEARDHDAVAGA